MRNARLDESQAGIKIAGRNIKTSDTQMAPPLWQKVKNLLIRVKEESKLTPWKESYDQPR